MATKPPPPREVRTPSIFTVSPYSASVAQEMYPGQAGVDDQRDAARHMLAAGTLARKYGVAPAELLGKMHEWSTSPIEALKMMLGAAPTPDYLMDTRNNAYGAQLGAQAKSQGELEDLVQREAERAQVEAPQGRATLLKPGYAKGGSVKNAKMLKSGEGPNELTKQYPELSGFLESLMGTAPDEMGSVLDPLTARRRAGAEYGFPVGTLANVAPGLGPLAKLAGRGAGAVARGGAEQIARAVEAGHPLTAGFAPMNVVKPKGGNWLMGQTERITAPLKGRTDLGNYDPPGTWVPSFESSRNEPLNSWVDKQLTRYIKNEMGTPEDPIRALAERGISHIPQPGPAHGGGRWEPESLRGRRVQSGFPAEGLGHSEMAKEWEQVSDEAIHNLPAGEHLRHSSASLIEANPWLAKVPPETTVYGNYSGGDLNMRHLIDELRNATNPESGLPPELLLKYSSLPQVSVPQAVERVAKINEWRAAQKVAADAVRAQNPATQVFKEYAENNPKGLKWVELKSPKAELPEGTIFENPNPQFGSPFEFINPEGKVLRRERTRAELEKYLARDAQAAAGNKPLEDALKYEGEVMGHCVGGYCPDVVSGKSRIFSLRSGKGEPHVTIEVQPKGAVFSDVAKHTGREEAERLLDQGVTLSEMIKGIPDFKYPQQIKQIKGKGNRAPAEEYLPYVQDFVKSGQWSDVGDLQNTGLLKLSDFEGRMNPELMKRAQAEFGPYATQADMEALHAPRPDAPTEPGFAAGGLVNDSISGYNPARVDELVNQLRTELFQ